MQLEIAFNQIFQDEIKNPYKGYTICGVPNNNSNSIQDFTITRLNGAATFISKQSGTYGDIFDTFKHPKIGSREFKLFEKELADPISRHPCLLNFAWEKDKHSQKAIEYAKNKVSEAHVIVVIGYSFPDFNRFIDKEIFQNSNPNKVYVQDLDPESIIEKLNGVGSKLRPAEPITNTEQFWIPYEFWEEI
jgi:hypothetical protein